MYHWLITHYTQHITEFSAEAGDAHQAWYEYIYLLVADGTIHAGVGARHPWFGGDPLALQLSWVGGNHSLGHKHGWQIGIGS